MTMAALEQKRQRKRKLKTVDEVFDWTIKEIGKMNELFFKRKREVILETARKLDEETDIEKSQISTEITKRLEGFVDQSWVNKILKDLPQYKDEKHVKSARNRRINPATGGEDSTKQAQNESPKIEEDVTNVTPQVEQPQAEQRPHSINQEAKQMVEEPGRPGKLNEEHECFKDGIIKELEAENERLKERIAELESMK